MAARLREDVKTVREKFELLSPALDEKGRRLWAATEARSLGYGGIAAVSEATGLSRDTIERGMKELEDPEHFAPEGRTRRVGAGRKPLKEKDPTLAADLEALVEPTSRGDPESPLRWTCKSTRNLAAELNAKGHRISYRSVATLLEELGYSLQANAKTREGKQHPDRNAQFEHINERVEDYQARDQPVISVDTKKKELVGNFKNPGREWHPSKDAPQVSTHDFPDPGVGKGIPYGVYDVSGNKAWVSVGRDHDTSEFAVQTIRNWWRQMGQRDYPDATELLITADGGGSNGYRRRLWKLCLQELADETGLQISVCHFPPGTSKWNKIEHRLFSEITKNWRGRPLTSHEVIVKLIGSTRTDNGLRVRCKLDPHQYEKGIEVSVEEMSELSVTRDEFHGEWNYTVTPRE